ncbi:MAG TPA: LysM peptidoglycan-binding domain-containing protein [Candidatus Binatia bacterium]|nr:LysM peptidoglycan-binding domain-containing protein [Candidatus Binatia bacterium]
MDKLHRFIPGVVIIAAALLFATSPLEAGRQLGQGDQPRATPAPGPTVESAESGNPAPLDWSAITVDGSLDTSAGPSATPDSAATPVPPIVAPQEQGEEEAAQPPATPEPVQTPASSGTPYTIKWGDTLYTIALSFGIPLNSLIAANTLPDPNRLDVGQVITIPDLRAGPVVVEPAASVTDGATPPEVTEGNYTVQRGDTLFKIAQRYGVDLNTLIAVNQLANPNRLEVGQVLVISGSAPPAAQPTVLPPTPSPQPTPAAPDPSQPASGQIYIVQRGDTLDKIARRFGTTVSTLVALNNLPDPNRIMAGQELLVESGTPDTIPTETPTPESTTNPSGTIERLGQPGDSMFIWPIPIDEGWLVKPFQYGHRAIDVILPMGTPIKASAGGIIEFSGWNSGGYGNLVVIDHGNGYRTLYAHQSERLVATDDRVAQGQIIGLVGSTGWSTDPHLHFEVIIDNQRVDPCLYLPGGCY